MPECNFPYPIVGMRGETGEGTKWYSKYRRKVILNLLHYEDLSGSCTRNWGKILKSRKNSCYLCRGCLSLYRPRKISIELRTIREKKPRIIFSGITKNFWRNHVLNLFSRLIKISCQRISVYVTIYSGLN